MTALRPYDKTRSAERLVFANTFTSSSSRGLPFSFLSRMCVRKSVDHVDTARSPDLHDPQVGFGGNDLTVMAVSTLPHSKQMRSTFMLSRLNFSLLMVSFSIVSGAISSGTSMCLFSIWNANGEGLSFALNVESSIDPSRIER